MIAAWLTALMAFLAGWLMCAVFTSGKLEDEYQRGYNKGYENARKKWVHNKGEWQSD